MIKTFRVWKNRQKKWIDQMLFPNYIFVKAYSSDLYNISRVYKIVNCIHCAGRPATLSSNEVERIEGLMNFGKEVTVEPKLTLGKRVLIIEGPLAGYEGILYEQKGRRKFGIQIKEINHTILIDANISTLEILS
jgi:transcription antitermination factor NusG